MPIKIEYEKVGDYMLPKIKPPMETSDTSYEEKYTGKYGEMRRRFLKENRPAMYTELFMAGKVEHYLQDFNAEMTEKIDLEVERLLKADPAPDKNAPNLGWVQHMNKLKSIAEETVLGEIYL